MTRPGKSVLSLLLAVLLLFTTACATRQAPHPVTPAKKPRPYKVLGKWYQPLASAHGYDEVGIASWYGQKFHGRLTASGETYNMHAMTAAHKTLPLGTMVKVRHLDSGKEVVLKINDRGPFVGKRIIDLSNKAAHAIGMVGTGTAKVRVTALTGKGRPAAKALTRGDFGVQVGSFGDQANAEIYAEKLASRYNQLPVKAIQGKDGLNRVVVGHLTNREAALDLKIRLMEDGFNSAFVLEL
jgi:rare lipoprotein A